MEERKILERKSFAEQPPGRPRNRCEDNIKIGLKEICCKGRRLLELNQHLSEGGL
jgi:hypothetical protein